ncbi:MAG TPA: threonine/serine dehydratase [Candidatus Limnocylindrales bacterium]|nr:threonine/serine dehydratase [Candidatus Limnocylindrales bacterium]
MPDPVTHDVSLADVEAAAARIAGRVQTTPMLSSRAAARVVGERTGVTVGPGPDKGGQPRLFLKAEHLQLTGSFKPRGALNRVMQLDEEERRRGIVTLSAGNHAQAVAWAAASYGVPVTVVMPLGASRAKVAATEGYGATVILHGQHVGDTFTEMERLRDEQGLVYLPPFDDPDVIAGQGTVGLEIVEQLPAVDVVVVGVGGGGLISGISSAVRRLRPEARVYGVEPERSNALGLALAAGKVVPLAPVSIADGLGAPFAGEWTLDIVRRLVTEVVSLDEPTIARGVIFALERCKQLLEPAGAAALGAVLAGRIPLNEGETVCVVASGGNVDLARLDEIHGLAAPPR